MKGKNRICKHSRVHTVRRRMLTGIFWLCCTVCFLCGFLLRIPRTVVMADSVQENEISVDPAVSGMDTADRTNRQKYYTSVSVNQGDSLYGIAEKYFSEEYQSVDDFISEIKQINHMHSDHLEPGNYLIVPYYDTRVS